MEQSYIIEVNNEHVIRGNAAILKCVIPSFVADFLAVKTWSIEGALIEEISIGSFDFGKVKNYFILYLLSRNSSLSVFKVFVLFPVVAQEYSAEVMAEHVIRGNAAILKCFIPSFVSDFVGVESWVADDGYTYFPSNDFGKNHHCC